jgi:hypothetical protein
MGKLFSASQSVDEGRLSREQEPAYAPGFYAGEKASRGSDYAADGGVNLVGSALVIFGRRATPYSNKASSRRHEARLRPRAGAR